MCCYRAIRSFSASALMAGLMVSPLVPGRCRHRPGPQTLTSSAELNSACGKRLRRFYAQSAARFRSRRALTVCSVYWAIRSFSASALMAGLMVSPLVPGRCRHRPGPQTLTSSAELNSACGKRLRRFYAQSAARFRSRRALTVCSVYWAIRSFSASALMAGLMVSPLSMAMAPAARAARAVPSRSVPSR